MYAYEDKTKKQFQESDDLDVSDWILGHSIFVQNMSDIDRKTILNLPMLHEYIKLLDEIREDDIQYQAYYRNRFLHIADHLAEQIEYDYDEAVEKCRKKREKEDDSDIGEDAMVLSVKYAGRGQKKKKGDEDEQRTNNQNQEPGAGMP